MKISVAAITAVLTLSFAGSAFAAQNVTITAKNFQFTPSVVTLKAGEPVEFHLQATQGVHELNVPQVGLKSVMLTASKTTVHAVPQKKGTFVSHCALYCGIGHPNMKITFVVK